MMKSLKLSLTLTLLAALSMGSMHAMESTTPQKKQQLLQRLVTQYKINRALIRQSQIHAFKLPKERIKQLRAKRRKILKRVAIAGLTAAFLAAIGVAVGVAAKKYWEREKAPAGPPPTFGGVHESLKPPGMAPTHKWKKGVSPGATEPFVAEDEKFDDLAAWEAEEAKLKRKKSLSPGTLHPQDEPPEYEQIRRKIGEGPEIQRLLGETE